MRRATTVSVLPCVAFVATLAWAAAGAANEEAEAEGSVCIATFSPPAPHDASIEEGGIRRPRSEVTYAFAVQIDAGDRIAVPRAEPVSVALATGERHLVKIFDGDRLIESFHFTFEARQSSHLCLSYGDYYQAWQLEPPLPAAKWCRCEPPPGPR